MNSQNSIIDHAAENLLKIFKEGVREVEIVNEDRALILDEVKSPSKTMPPKILNERIANQDLSELLRIARLLC